MKLLDSLRIKEKLFFLGFLPLFGLLYFALSNVQDKWTVAEQMMEIEILSGFAVTASALVHETQKERGATAGFLGSKGTSFITELPAQQKNTDKKISELRSLLEIFDAQPYGKEFSNNLSKAIRHLDNINSIRNSVRSQTIDVKEAIGYYTSMNADFLNSIGVGIKVTDHGKIVSQVAAYSNFLLGKERAGIERAVLSNAFARDNFAAGQLRFFGALVTEQETYIRVFKAFANMDQKIFYNKVLSGPVVQRAEKMRNTAFQKGNEGNFGIQSTNWFKAATDRIDLLKQVENKLSDDLYTRASELKIESQGLFIFYSILAASLICLVTVTIVVFSRSITQPLNEALHAIEDIAEGDLTRRLDVEGGRSEIARIAQAINKFGDQISNVITEVKNNASAIGLGSEQISAGNADLAQRTEAQASSLEETSASMEQMITAVQQNAESTQQASKLSNTAKKEAEEGGAVISNAVEAMGEISEASTKIVDIITTIDGIAFQTNLLALNAAVEAARAGDQGRGFAVVASEVRTLAQRSAEAAKEIKGLIEDSVGKIKTGTELVAQSGQTLLGLVEGIKEVAVINGAISNTSREQSSGIDQVNKAISELDGIAQQNSSLVEQSTSASMSMRDQADSLIELIEFFKVDDETAESVA